MAPDLSNASKPWRETRPATRTCHFSQAANRCSESSTFFMSMDDTATRYFTWMASPIGDKARVTGLVFCDQNRDAMTAAQPMKTGAMRRKGFSPPRPRW